MRGRACIAAALGEKAAAVEFLGEAFAEGLGYDLNWHSEPYLDPIRDEPGVRELLRPKG